MAIPDGIILQSEAEHSEEPGIHSHSTLCVRLTGHIKSIVIMDSGLGHFVPAPE
jgi:hypothetical protein